MVFPKCAECGLTLIEEEVSIHECKDAVDYRFDGDILWMSDGEIWYPRKLLQQPKSNKNKTTDKETEP